MSVSPLQILVIEDNTPDVMLIGESLQEEGIACQIKHCRDGEEALAHMRSSDGHTPAYDLVILDLNMPKLGVWTCSRRSGIARLLCMSHFWY